MRIFRNLQSIIFYNASFYVKNFKLQEGLLECQSRSQGEGWREEHANKSSNNGLKKIEISSVQMQTRCFSYIRDLNYNTIS